jgi:GNAT superfamily N-acetyltransferase
MWEDMKVGDPPTLDRADSVYRKWVRAEIRNGHVVGWVVQTANHEIVGGGCLWLRPEQPRPNLSKPIEPYLFSMFTEPKFRRKGIASLILNEAIKWSRKNDYRRILLHASKKGRRLYRRYGFTRTWEMRFDLYGGK